ncbi:ribosomal protein L6 [Cantharellus anzutake]|uniref:ribosomal protein L6 n=1 Tax=Cantharellus anzutake TaxID=1750568 RepID=UPI001908B681|nr:ribosomal protein L6 [Cantharellus anzutake]KAF8333435.1 ribosomal protein L6 [Cantharellus anzutake]
MSQLSATNRLLVRSFRTSTRTQSHIGLAPIAYPPSVAFTPEAGSLIITSPKGEQRVPLPSFVRISTRNAPLTDSSIPLPANELTVAVEDPSIKGQRASWGLTRALIANAVTGLTDGFAVALKLVGVGFRAEMDKDPFPTPETTGQRLKLKLNYAHFVYVPIPRGIVATVPNPTRIVLRGSDKQQLGQFAATVRSWRKPEPYKGKGIFVGDETIRLKDVKKK